MRTLSHLALLVPVLGLAAAAASSPRSAPATPEPAPFHCQVPCGIYGDQMRIDMLMEDLQTIEKGMAQIREMESGELVYNQMVRWVMTKDEHAQKIQDQVASYWLAQRIKAPKDGSDAAAREKYLRQLELMHQITVAAMKCKQTTDAAHVEAARRAILAFADTYFDEEARKHIREHHGADHR